MVDGEPNGRISLTDALCKFPESLPPEYWHLTLAQLRNLWSDEAHRARLRPSLERLASATAPELRDVGQFLHALTDAIAETARLLAAAQAKARHAAVAVAASGRLTAALPGMAATYCRPYQRQIAKLSGGSFPRLAQEAELRFFLMALVLATEEEIETGARPPLAQVALAAGLVDIAASALWRDHPDLAPRLAALRDEHEHWHYFENTVFLALAGDVLPRLSERLAALTPATARQRVGDWLTRRYLATALRHDVVDGWRQQRGREARGGALPGPEQTAEVADPQSDPEREDRRIAVAQVVGQYLADSDRPDVDRAIAEAIASGMPMEALARRMDVPARTLRYRQDRLLRHCRRRLGLDG